MDCSGGTEKTRTVILVTQKTQRVILVALKIHCVILVLIITNSKKTQHDGKPDFPCIPEIHSVMKIQHDGKPDFPCVPETRSVPLVSKKIQYDQRSHSMCMVMTNPGTDGNKRIRGRKILISQGIMGIFLEERTGFQCIIKWSNL